LACNRELVTGFFKKQSEILLAFRISIRVSTRKPLANTPSERYKSLAADSS